MWWGGSKGPSRRGRALTAGPALPAPHSDLPDSSCPRRSSPSPVPLHRTSASRVVNRKPCRGHAGGEGLQAFKLLAGQFSEVLVFKKNRKKVPEHSPLMLQTRLNTCLCPASPAAQAQGPRLVDNHHHARSHEAGERPGRASLAGGVGCTSQRTEQRSAGVQGGGQMRWAGWVTLSGSSGEGSEQWGQVRRGLVRPGRKPAQSRVLRRPRCPQGSKCCVILDRILGREQTVPAQNDSGPTDC